MYVGVILGVQFYIEEELRLLSKNSNILINGISMQTSWHIVDFYTLDLVWPIWKFVGPTRVAKINVGYIFDIAFRTAMVNM